MRQTLITLDILTSDLLVKGNRTPGLNPTIEKYFRKGSQGFLIYPSWLSSSYQPEHSDDSANLFAFVSMMNDIMVESENIAAVCCTC